LALIGDREKPGAENNEAEKKWGRCASDFPYGVCLANDTVGEVRGLTEIREKIEVMSLRDLNQEAH